MTGDGRRWIRGSLGAVLLLGLVALLGDSVAVAGLGAATVHPPWDLAAAAGPVPVTVLAGAGYLLGGAALWSGLRAVRSGTGLPAPRHLVTAGLVAAFAFTAVPPSGSADHLSYLAYGRIAVAGDDAYAQAPGSWRGGTDPVAGAVQPPWRDTPSVYGPAATAAFALAARLGADSLRASVWAWSLLCALAFAAVALALDRAHRGDVVARQRAAVLWTANPVLLGQLVLGAHVDVLATALAVGALRLTVRHRLPAAALAGAMVGLAASVKAPYAVFGLAAVWGLRPLGRPRWPRAAAVGLLGAVAVAVPAHLLAGPRVFDQLGTASGFTSIASPWRALVNLVELGAGSGSLRPAVLPAALLAATVVAVLVGPRILGAAADRDGPHRVCASSEDTLSPGRLTAAVESGTARAALVVAVAWVLCAPYTLPWYDAMVWAPLALVATVTSDELAGLENALLVRLVVLTLAYLPGRVVGLTETLETITLGFRRYLAPALLLVTIVAVLLWSRRRGSLRRSPAAAAG